MNLYSRYDLPKLLLEHDVKYGIELGVAAGKFSSHLLTNYNFKEFYGVDSYNDHHDVKQYKKWLCNSQKFSNDILNSWFLKLKQNGIFSGRCYETRWPENRFKTTPGNSLIDTNLFVKEHDLQLNIIEETPDKTTKTDKTTKRSWYIIKP